MACWNSVKLAVVIGNLEHVLFFVAKTVGDAHMILTIWMTSSSSISSASFLSSSHTLCMAWYGAEWICRTSAGVIFILYWPSSTGSRWPVHTVQNLDTILNNSEDTVRRHLIFSIWPDSFRTLGLLGVPQVSRQCHFCFLPFYKFFMPWYDSYFVCKYFRLLIFQITCRASHLFLLFGYNVFSLLLRCGTGFIWSQTIYKAFV